MWGVYEDGTTFSIQPQQSPTFDVLTTSDTSSIEWVSSTTFHNGSLPGGTVIGGQLTDQEFVYVARGQYSGQDICGFYDQRNEYMELEYSGAQQVSPFEVLVFKEAGNYF